MKRNKKGFTLSEVLICLTIIGVIMAISVKAIKTVKTSYTSLTYFAHRNIQAITRQLMMGQTAKETEESSSVILCKKSDGKSVFVLKPDSEVDVDSTPLCSNLPSDESDGSNIVCHRMTENLNTAGSINCQNLYSVRSADGAEPIISDFNEANPNFITTNGYRYYLTKRTFDKSVSTEYGFRLLAVDLNGKTPPNIINRKTSKTPPDIVTFMIMDNGEIYPLGEAADNLKINEERTAQYLPTRAKGYYYSQLDPSQSNKANIPDSCYRIGKQVCDFRVVPIKNTKGATVYSYREAYCYTLGGDTPTYSKYCNGIETNELCPPSTKDQRFDTCQMEIIKPAFRYKL